MSRPAGRPRTRPATERRDDLLKAAERLFLKNGVEQTTVEEITQAAAVSKGAFYLHFSSKAGVVEGLRARFVEGVLARIVAGVEEREDGDWNGRLTAWARACTIGYLDARKLHDLVFAAAPPPSREGLARNPLTDNLAELLVAGNSDGAWSLDRPAFTAVFLFNAIHGAVNQAVDDAIADQDQLLHDVEDHFQRVVSGARR